jgi:hypothetical protein
VKDSLSFDLGIRAASIEGGEAEEVRLGFTWAVPVWEPAGAKNEARLQRGLR